MEDKTIGNNLPQQGYLGAPTAGVVGTIVPGAPTSSSYEGLAKVLEAGTSVQSAPVVEKKDLNLEKDPYAGQSEEMRSIEDILQDINMGYEVTTLSAEGPKDSFDIERDTFFGDSPPAGYHQKSIEDMEVAQEISNKKRKADVSLVVGSSSEDEDITPSHLLRRRRRRNRLVDPSPEKENISDPIDLTADYETPHESDYTNVESIRKKDQPRKRLGGFMVELIVRSSFLSLRRGEGCYLRLKD